MTGRSRSLSLFCEKCGYPTPTLSYLLAMLMTKRIGRQSTILKRRLTLTISLLMIMTTTLVTHMLVDGGAQTVGINL